MDQAVLKSLTPGQQVIKIVRDEMLALFGDAEGGLQEDAPRRAWCCCSACRARARRRRPASSDVADAKQGRHPLMVSTDVRRPAAIQQLRSSASRPACGCYDRPARWIRSRAREGALAEAARTGFDAVIVDTAGRLHIDDELMTELQAIKDAVQPSDLLYVADAMTGQDAIKSAGEFNRRVGVTGVVLTKLDGDARGGAALSVVSVVGVPIAFVGSGERLEDLELFHPDRDRVAHARHGRRAVAHREGRAGDRPRTRRELEEKLRQERVHARRLPQAAEDDQADGAAREHPRDDPGLGNLKQLAENKPDEKQMGRVEAIIGSMTPDERRQRPDHQRQPAQADREGQRHDGRRGEPAAEAVRPRCARCCR